MPIFLQTIAKEMEYAKFCLRPPGFAVNFQSKIFLLRGLKTVFEIIISTIDL